MRTKHAQTCLAILVFGCSVSMQAGAQQDADHYAQAIDTVQVGPSDYILQSGIPSCGDGGNPSDLLKPDVVHAAIDLAKAVQIGTPIQWGSVFALGAGVWHSVGGQTAGTGAILLDRLFGNQRYARCALLAVAIPSMAHLIHANFFATEVSGNWQSDSNAGCGLGRWIPSRGDTGFNCDGIGWSAFDQPHVETRGPVTIYWVVFRNWSGGQEGRTRIATMDVLWYY